MTRARFATRLGALGAALVAMAILLSPTAQAQEGRMIEVFLHDDPFHIAPDRILANPDETLTFQIQNRGILGHDFRICRPPAEGGCDSPVAFVPVLQPGQWGNITVQMPPPGTYQFECAVPGHADAGMMGELVVGPAKDTPGPPLLLLLAGIGVAIAVQRRRT